MSAADWLDRATQVLNDARALLTNFGHAPDPTLHIELDLHPCPGYSHEDSSIRFCPPVIESIVDELRWSFFRSLMGCASREETVEFYDCALPLIVCHELAHHLRIRRGVAQDSHFHEEQICDRLAVAMVESMPRHASTLAPLQAHCARMRQRLEHRYEHRHGWAFLPSILEVLDARGALDVNVRASLERLCAQRASMDFDQLLAVLPGISEEELAAARAARARARAQVDADYARDPAEYWHLSLAWLERYLARARRPSLAAVLNAHLPIEPKSNEELLLTVQETLEHDSSLHARVLAASTLLIHYGGAVVHDLLDVVEVEWKRSQAPAHDAACALLRALTNAWPERGHALDDAARRVLSWLSPSTSDERFVAAFELAARARVSAVRYQSIAPLTERAQHALWATDPAAFSDRIRSALLERAPLGLLEALERGSFAMPSDLGDALLQRSLDITRRSLIVLLCARASETPCESLLTHCKTFARDPRSPQHLANAARSVLVRAGSEHLLSALPPVGSVAFEHALASLRHLERRTTATVDRSSTSLREQLRAEAALCALDANRSRVSLALVSRALLAHGSACEQLATELQRSTHDQRLHGRLLLREARGVALEVCCAWVSFEERTTLDALGASSLDAESTDPFWYSLIEKTSRRVEDALASQEEVAPVRANATPARADTEALEHDGGAPTDRASSTRETLVRSLLSPILRAIIERATGDASSSIASNEAAELADSDSSRAMRTLLETVVYLQTTPLFARLDVEQLEALARATHELRFSEGEYIFRQGDHGDSLYLLVDGAVEIRRESDDRTLELATLTAPAYFGEIAMLDAGPRTASARVLRPSRLLYLDGEALRTIGHQNPTVYEQLLRSMAMQVRTLTAMLARAPLPGQR